MNQLSGRLPLWAEAKNLSFVIDSQVPFSLGGLKTHSDGIAYVASGEMSEQAERFHQLLYELGIVAPEHLPSLDLDVDLQANVAAMNKDELNRAVTWVCRADRFVDSWLVDGFNSKFLTRALRRLYLLTVCAEDGWPRTLLHSSDRHIEEGIPLFSLSGTIEGRTTGSRRKCAAKNCPGWFIGVLWETGQQMFICSEGWHYNPESNRIDVVGGGEISARFVSPKPLGVPPLPSNEWPDHQSLAHRKGWRIKT